MKKEEQVIQAFWDFFNKKMWLEGLQLKSSLQGYTPSEIHCVEYIGNNKDTNVTKLAETFYMTRSGVTKLTKKMINKRLIENYQKEGNKKEVCFRLTKQGRKVNAVHEALDKEFELRDKDVFKQFTDAEYDIMIHFAEVYNEHLEKKIEELGGDITSGYDRL